MRMAGIIFTHLHFRFEVTEEGERDKDLNEKFLCYCEKNDGELSGLSSFFCAFFRCPLDRVEVYFLTQYLQIVKFQKRSTKLAFLRSPLDRVGPFERAEYSGEPSRSCGSAGDSFYR